jgi:siroheme synthase
MRLERILEQLPELAVTRCSHLTAALLAELKAGQLTLALCQELTDADKSADGLDWFRSDAGYVCFAAGHVLLQRIRTLFVSKVVMAGAAPRLGMCTLEAVEAMRQAEVCLHDTLFDPEILNQLPADAKIVNVGKRCGKHAVKQPEINRMLLDYAREGKRVLRLKAGDPGIFGRLCEETDTLSAYGLPFEVQAAVSSLSAATTATGLLLTRRCVHRGFTVMTPRCAGGAIGELDPNSMDLPVVLFMATHILEESFAKLQKCGMSAETPASIIFDAGTPQQTVITGTVATLPGLVADLPSRTGLVYAGTGAGYELWPDFTALGGRRIKILNAADVELAHRVTDLGGQLERVPENADVYGVDELELLAEQLLVTGCKQELRGEGIL